MSKKGAEFLSVYWFAIIFIVAAAIVYMVSSFYGKPYDVREIEANLLTDKIADCLSSDGYINENWRDINDENLNNECGLNFNVEDTYGWRDDQYYIEIQISDFNSGIELSSISAGNPNLNNFCGLKGEKMPFCLEREFYSVDKLNKQYKIKIISIVAKIEKNV